MMHLSGVHVCTTVYVLHGVPIEIACGAGRPDHRSRLIIIPYIPYHGIYPGTTILYPPMGLIQM